MQVRKRLSSRSIGQDGLRAQLLRGGMGSLVIKLIYVILQFATSIGLARFLEPAGYGAYSYVVALVGLFAIPANLGFPTYLTRTVAVYREEGEVSLLRGLLIRSRQTVVLAATILAAIGVAVIRLSDANRAGIDSRVMSLGMLLLPLYALAETIGGGIRGLGHVLLAQIPDQLIRPVLFLAFTFIFVAFNTTITPMHAISANIAASLVAVIIADSLLRFVVRKAIGDPTLQIATKEWLFGALPFSLLAGSQLLNHHADIIMLGKMLGDEPVGLYRVAVQTSDGINMILMAITAVIAPQLARLYTRGDWSSIQRILVSAHRLGIALLLPASVLLVLFRDLFITIAFGAEYLESSEALLILVVGRVAYATVGFSGMALSMFGHPGLATLANLFTVAMNLSLNFVLIPLFGIVGAALATTVSDFAVNGMLAVLVRMKYGRNITAFGKSGK